MAKTSKGEPRAPEPPRPPGRLRAAWSVLRGQRLVPAQIQAEWLEYQLIFDDLLSRMSSSLARQAKAERKRLRRLAEAEPSSTSDSPQLQLLPNGSGSSSKAQLRSLAAQRLGLGSLQRQFHQHHDQSHQVEEVAE